MTDAVPPDWSRYRAYLRVLASAGVELKLQSKLDPSDVVQQTLLQAYRALPSHRGSTEAEMMAWLRQILARNITGATREFARGRRDVHRERDIEAAINSSSIRLEKILPANDESPLDAAIKGEYILRVCEAVEDLPDAQRQAIDLHYWQGLIIDKVAEKMERTPAAIAGLLKRGLKALRTAVNREL